VSPEPLLDPFFRVPFLAGLGLAATLPLLGTLLRLREEWLAALGFAHLAGASALAGLALGVPAVLGAPLGALAGALAKALGGLRGSTVYAVMILGGWGATLLVATNTVLGNAMGHALVEGQLYFAGLPELGGVLVLVFLVVVGLPWLVPRLVRARFFPADEAANRRPAWRWHLGFDLLAALGMAVGTGTLGLMAAFALVFVPPWIAFRLAGSWRAVLYLSAGAGVLVYLVAFAAALVLDQPFGPVLVTAALLAAAPGLWAARTGLPRKAGQGRASSSPRM
jgi:zinc transport system permease protein